MTESVGEVESPQQETQSVADASTEDLRNIMANEPVAAPEQSVDQQEPVQEPAPAPETEPVPTGEPVETEPERQAKRRIRPRTALDQQVLDLYKSEAFDGSFADASRVIYGQQQQETQTLQAAQVEDINPDVLSEYDERVKAVQSEIAELEIKVDEAAENLETSEALKLQRDITRRELEVQRLTRSKEREIERRRENAYNTHRTKAEESRDRALESNPELRDTESLPRKQFDEYVRRAQQDPDYTAIFNSPLWPEMMVREFNEVVASHQQQQQQQQPPPQTPPVMGNQAQVLTSGTTVQPANAPVTEQQVAANMGQMSNDQLYALLGQDDGRRAPLR